MSDLEEFEQWLTHTLHDSKENVSSVMRVVKRFSQGKGITIGPDTFAPLDGVMLRPWMVTEEMCDAAREWAPRGSKTELEQGRRVDTSKGWALHHPLLKLLKFKHEVLGPKKEHMEYLTVMNTKIQTFRPVSADTVGQFRKRKSWVVDRHIATNREETISTAVFLKACLLQKKHAWRFIAEFPFGNKQRCDLFMICDELQVVVESKTHNLLHGLGQVIHYHELAKQDVPGYASAKTMMLVILASAPRPSEVKTANGYGVHVWWPDGPRLPF